MLKKITSRRFLLTVAFFVYILAGLYTGELTAQQAATLLVRIISVYIAGESIVDIVKHKR